MSTATNFTCLILILPVVRLSSYTLYQWNALTDDFNELHAMVECIYYIVKSSICKHASFTGFKFFIMK
jgi:hypothetical protein